MMNATLTRWLLASALLGLTVTALAQQPNSRRKPNPALAPVQDDARLPRVLLIGDSISIGYTIPTRAALAGRANVHRIPENGGDTKRGLASLDRWLGDGKWDVIHFNWGLHDLKFVDGQRATSVEQYEANLRKLVKRLQQAKAKLIWCSTTPVPSGKLNPPRSDEDVQAYNAAALRVMQEHGVEVNDLYAFALPQLEKLQRPQNVHFHAEGSERLAQEVARRIAAALKGN